MDGLGLESFVENSSLESSVQNLVYGKTQDVIELELFIGKETISVHSSKKGSTFEKSSWVFLLQSEEFSGSLSELGEGKMASPYVSFVFKTIFSEELKLMIDSFLFERSSGCVGCFGIYDKKKEYSCGSFCP